VVNALPLPGQATVLFDARFFAALKPMAYFINVGRGRTPPCRAELNAQVAVRGKRRATRLQKAATRQPAINSHQTCTCGEMPLAARGPATQTAAMLSTSLVS